ncbi:MAG: diguanylate cyclase [Betaproteobacteria bacterium]|nr:diguanylate cyclase [Betaproteobacteria bacterium]
MDGLAHDVLAAGSDHFRMARHPERILFWCADALGGCELVSANWELMTGQLPDAALHDGWLDCIAGEDRPAVAAALREAAQNRCGFRIAYHLRLADGALRRVTHEGAARTLPSGVFNGLIGTISEDADSEAGEIVLQRSAQQIFAFLDQVPLAAIAVDLAGRATYANAVLFGELVVDRRRLLGSHWIEEWVAGTDRPAIADLVGQAVTPTALPREVEYHVETDGGRRLYRWHLTVICDARGQAVSVVMMGSDITRWREGGDRLRLTAQVFDHAKEAMVITDRTGSIIAVNDSFTRLTGYAREEAIGQNPRILQSGRHDAGFYRQMWESLARFGYWRGDIWDKRKDGSLYPKFLAITAIRDENGEVARYSAIFYDITDRKALEAELDYLAHYDPLTGLPNRMLLQDRLEREIAASARLGQHFALLFIDLDGFKAVNDVHGHGAGDELLQVVAQRLLAATRAMDTAARFGGDEFVVILTDVRDAAAAEKTAAKIVESLSAAYTLSGPLGPFEATISASVGVSLYPSDDQRPSDLINSADRAMYAAKNNGKGRVILHGRLSFQAS